MIISRRNSPQASPQARNSYRRMRGAESAQLGIELSEASTLYSFTSEQLECPVVSQGKIMLRDYKVCCVPPWTKASRGRRRCVTDMI